MTDIEKLIQIAREEGGKFIVLNAKGGPELVILPFADYERLRQSHHLTQSKDPELVNQEITAIQAAEVPKAQYVVPPKVEASGEEIDTSFDY